MVASYLIKNTEDLDNFSKNLIQSLTTHPVSGACVLALSGDLGSGKTSLTQSISAKLGIKDRVKSPTFVIMDSYQISFDRFRRFFHIDAYRLKNAGELEKLGIKSILEDNNSLVIIEWPERVFALIPQKAIKISLKFIDENTREITVKDA